MERAGAPGSAHSLRHWSGTYLVILFSPPFLARSGARLVGDAVTCHSGEPLICAALPVVSRCGPPLPEGVWGRAVPVHPRGGEPLTDFDSNIPSQPTEKQWTWVSLTVAAIALAIIIAVL